MLPRVNHLRVQALLSWGNVPEKGPMGEARERGGLRTHAAIAALGAAILLVAGCAATPPPAPPQPQAVEQPSKQETGIASWYGRAHQGRPTANGETYDRHKLTAAHRSLPFDTVVRVTNIENGKQVLVRINDRGPYRSGRIIDLSERAAQALGMREDGIVRVRLEVRQADQSAAAIGSSE
jgi:rare lipoprotein A